MMIIIKVFVKRDILSMESVLGAFTNTHTHARTHSHARTHTHARTNALTHARKKDQKKKTIPQ